MKHLFLRRNQHEKLFLFFSGWGGDENIFDHNLHPDYDYLLCYDYEDENFDETLLNGYKEIYLYAWSLGVYTASRILNANPTFIRKVAINGTLYPNDDSKGIEKEVFKQTVENFSPVGLVKFRRRMCIEKEQLKAFLDHHPKRSLESLKTELECLYRRIKEVPHAIGLTWDLAIIGTRDMIFKTQNQMNAWAETPHRIMDIAHYDDKLFNEIFNNP